MTKQQAAAAVTTAQYEIFDGDGRYLGEVSARNRDAAERIAAREWPFADRYTLTARVKSNFDAGERINGGDPACPRS